MEDLWGQPVVPSIGAYHALCFAVCGAELSGRRAVFSTIIVALRLVYLYKRVFGPGVGFAYKDGLDKRSCNVYTIL